MTTTIQVTNDLDIARYIEINGVRCKVEAVSFSGAITEANATEELLRAITERLIEEKILTVDSLGSYRWGDSGELVIPDEDYVNLNGEAEIKLPSTPCWLNAAKGA